LRVTIRVDWFTAMTVAVSSTTEDVCQEGGSPVPADFPAGAVAHPPAAIERTNNPASSAIPVLLMNIPLLL
jgi:hypothetical protein